MKFKTLIQLLGWIVFILTVFLFVYSLINYSALEKELSGKVREGGYIIIFVFSFLLEGLPQILSPDIVLIAGALVKLNMAVVFIVIIVSCTLSSLFFYFIGYTGSRRIALNFVDENAYYGFIKLSKKWGKFALAIAALTPVPYLPIIPGMMKMRFSDFLVFGIAMRIIKYGVITIILVLLL